MLARAFVAASLLPVVRDTLSLDIIHLDRNWGSVVGYIALIHLLIQLGVGSFTLLYWKRKRSPSGLHYLQIWLDILLATIVLFGTGEAATGAIALFTLPLLAISHMGPSLRWLTHLLAILAISGGAMFWVGTQGSIVLVVTSRVAILAAGTLVLRVYRVSQLNERFRADAAILAAQKAAAQAETAQEKAERSKGEAEAARRHHGAVRDATLCGIAILDLDGSIREWNRVQETHFASPEGKARRNEGLPCYRVFHDRDSPCVWCCLRWTPGSTDDIDAQDRTPEQSPHRFHIDVDDLKQKVEHGSNWCISNQLRAGEDTDDRFHLFHIYFGPYEENGEVTGVVESVTEITEAVLEMPFLAPTSTSVPEDGQEDDFRDVPQGLPPISVVSACENKKVLQMNRAKLRRCQVNGVRHRSKDDVLNLPCQEAYGRPSNSPRCEECVVEKAKLGTYARGITDYPGKALVTAVPVCGPDGQVRAVFEFIDPIDDLVAVEEASQAFNENLGDVENLLNEASRRLRDLAGADRCSILELHERVDSIIVHSNEGRSRPLCIDPAAKELVDQLREEKIRYKRIKDLSKEECLGRSLEKLGLGPGVLIPIATREGDLLAIASLERFKERPPFDEEKIIYCRLLADHLAVSMARARDFHRQQRFIEAMERTADVFGFEAALRKLLAETSDLLPRGVTLVGYVLKEESSRLALHYVSDSGSAASERHMTAEPRSRTTRREIPLTSDMLTILNAKQPKTRPRGSIDGRLVLLNSTDTVRVMPLAYQGRRLVGCIVAEASESDLGEAFPSSVKQFLTLVASYASIVCGRTELLKACMGTYGHHLTRAIDGARHVINADQRNGELATVGHRLAFYCHLLEADKKAWEITIGNSDVLSIRDALPKDIVEPMAKILRKENRGRRLEIEMPRVTRPFKCDAKCLQACVYELMQNALKFSDPETAVALFVSQEDDRTRFCVRNEGRLPERCEERVFEMFWRGQEHMGITGTGLGLWLVATLVREHPKGWCQLSRAGPNHVECSIEL